MDPTIDGNLSGKLQGSIAVTEKDRHVIGDGAGCGHVHHAIPVKIADSHRPGSDPALKGPGQLNVPSPS